jgi:hypothetical protein
VRSQLLTGGVLIVLMGVAFYVLELPLVYFWSFPFIIGGGLMALAAPFLPESEGPVKPPEGFKFCVFCSTPIPIAAEKCDHCSGTQPKE